nr:lipase family protein [Streptomyces pluripotens]
MKDWLCDAGAPARPGPGGNGHVHDGFGHVLDQVYPAVVGTLAELRTDGQGVFLTGHGLPVGALAMLVGARLYLEKPHLVVDGVYTYGQPRTCDRLLAEAFHNGFGGRMYRFVNDADIVSQLPPEPAFTHVRALRYFDSHGQLHDCMLMLSVLADRAGQPAAEAFVPTSDGIRDHFMRRYLTVCRRTSRDQGSA